jgi:hypothetical protein
LEITVSFKDIKKTYIFTSFFPGFRDKCFKLCETNFARHVSAHIGRKELIKTDDVDKFKSSPGKKPKDKEGDKESTRHLRSHTEGDNHLVTGDETPAIQIHKSDMDTHGADNAVTKTADSSQESEEGKACDRYYTNYLASAVC